jgi:hypothetical protein
VDVGFGFDFTGPNSATGTRTRVARARAEYPNQLDLADSDEVVGQGAGLPGGGWLGLPLVSRPPLFEGGMTQWYQIRRLGIRISLCSHVAACPRFADAELVSGRISAAWGPGEQANARITFESPVDDASSPGVEARLSRPQRDILTTRRYGLLHRRPSVTSTARKMPKDVPIDQHVMAAKLRR